jgi:hypothetical protein
MDINGMNVEGWITSTNTGDENIIYGVFKTQEEAEVWRHNLINGEVLPIFTPAFNRG